MTRKNILKKTLSKDGICIITFTNPEKRNPLTLALINQLQLELKNIKNSKMIKVLILKSTGPSFCSGHDLSEVKEFSKSNTKLLKLFKTCSNMMQTIREIPQPVIACVDGLAAAAGCQLVASCDLAIASQNSSFQTPGVNIGLFCSTPMVAISRKMKPKDMMYMLLTGEKVMAKAAKSYGLINDVVPKSKLDKQVLKIAKLISKKSLESINIGKVAFYKQLEMPMNEAYDYTSIVMAKNMTYKDAQEGINAFIQKRRPLWNKNK